MPRRIDCSTPCAPAAGRDTGLTRRHLLLSGAAACLGAGCARDEDVSRPDPSPHPVVPPPALGRKPTRPVDAPDIKVEALLLPGIINSANDGPFIDLLFALDEVYTGGRLDIQVIPSNRANDGVALGTADISFPEIRLPRPATQPGTRFSTATLGSVTFVIYSHKRRPITREHLKAAGRGGPAVRVESAQVAWEFPVLPFSSFESALRKLQAGRIDAFLWAQEEADAIVRALGMSDIHRAYYRNFDDVFLLPDSPRGDFVDRAMTRAVQRLRTDGRLDALYLRVHRPWDPWQPA